MATAQVVITKSSAKTPAVDGIFAGKSFFLLQRLPSRSSFIDKVQANGGRVVKQENQADYIIADHLRRDCPSGSLSYTFIETAIKNGELPDPNEHSAGPRQSAQREAGSAAPTKGTRTPFSAEDDRVLRQWVERFKANGGLVKGNEIYKQLEAHNARHTWQAWRDRYVKRLMDAPPPATEVSVPANPPPSPPTAQDSEREIRGQGDGTNEDVAAEAEGEQKDVEVEGDENEAEAEKDFTENDLQLLLEQAHDIEQIADDQWDDAWEAWADVHPSHLPASWAKFWVEKGVPAYERQKAERKRKRRREDNLDGTRGSESEGVDEVETGREPENVTDSGAPASQKMRKRQRLNRSASPEKTYGKKKRNSAGDDIFRQESSNDEASIHDPTSELNRAAAQQLQQESKETSESSSSSGESNSQADAQADFDEEVLGLPRKKGPLYIPTSNLPTSDVNLAADQQLRHESLELEDEEQMDGLESGEKSPSVHSQDEDGNFQTQVDINVRNDLLERPSDKLTEANLASQQAEHRAQLTRGTDLPEDDDAIDEDQQDEFVRYLQGVTRQSGAPVTLIPQSSDEPPNAESQLPQSQFNVKDDGLNTEEVEEIPLSSQQEIDETLEDMIKWPESPIATERPDASQSQDPVQQVESQIPYPQLPSQDDVLEPDVEEAVIDSQNSSLPQVSYPSLAPPEAPARTPHPTLGMQPSSQSVGSQQKQSSAHIRLGEDEDEIDLSLAAPEGGWSSPIGSSQSSNATPVPNQHSVQIKQESELASESQSHPHAIKKSKTVVEISSASSSSSSSSSSEELEKRSPLESRRRGPETQDILNAETQQPDFEIPLPPNSDDGLYDGLSDFSNPPSPDAAPDSVDSPPTLDNDDRIPDEEVDSYIDTRVFRGFPEASVVNALKRTSMRRERTELVLLEERAGKVLPGDVPGIWSEAEDEVLEGGDATALRVLEEKHGWPEMEARMKFFEEWREGEGDEG